MSWKDLSYVYKGAIIGLVYGVIASIITYIISFQGSRPGSFFILFNILFTWPLMISALPYVIFLYLNAFTGITFFGYIATFFGNVKISGPVILMLIGALIGWIVEKVKK